MTMHYGQIPEFGDERFCREVEEEGHYWLSRYLKKTRAEVWTVGHQPTARTFPTRTLAVAHLLEKWKRLEALLDEMAQEHGWSFSRRQAMDVLCEGQPIRRIEIPARSHT